MLSGEARWRSLVWNAWTASPSHSETTGPAPDGMIDSSSADEWRYRLCAERVGVCLGVWLRQMEGGRESLIETELVRSVIHSPVRSSFPRVHSSRLSTRRQEAKPLLSLPGWVNFPSLSFGKEASVSTGHLFFYHFDHFSLSHLAAFLLQFKRKKRELWWREFSE